MSKKDDEINRQLIFNSGGANPEDYLTPKQLEKYQKNPERFIDIDMDLVMNQEEKQNQPDPSQGVAAQDYTLDSLLYSTVAPPLTKIIGAAGGFLKTLRSKDKVLRLQDDEQPLIEDVPLYPDVIKRILKVRQDNPEAFQNIVNQVVKGSGDETGAGSERFLFGEDVFANMPKANVKALAKLGITTNESKLFISNYNKIGRDSAGAIGSVFKTYTDFENLKTKVFPAFAEEMKDVTQTKTPQLDHVAQLVASLGFFDGQPVQYWPEIARIVVKEGVFGLGHDAENLKYLAFDVHTVKSNFWRDNIGDAGEKFFKGRDLSTLPKLKAAAREYAAIIRKSNKLVAQANAQYKLLNKTNISQEELEEFISRLGANPLQSKYNIKQVKTILQQMEDDGFLVKPETVQAREAEVIKTEQKTAKAKADKVAKVDKEFQKSVVESETYRKYYASDPGKFKSPLVKGSKDDMLITHAEDIYEEMSVDKNPETKDAMIKKIMKIIKPRYKG
tara:strand:- start:96 stop:1601 length:1506 start_codon:yes stop_codon:yes gene_type:complete